VDYSKALPRFDRSNAGRRLKAPFRAGSLWAAIKLRKTQPPVLSLRAGDSNEAGSRFTFVFQAVSPVKGGCSSFSSICRQTLGERGFDHSTTPEDPCGSAAPAAESEGVEPGCVSAGFSDEGCGPSTIAPPAGCFAPSAASVGESSLSSSAAAIFRA
jgi:hypothetical protein